MEKKRILIIYEYFYPAYKAGGPIQSLVNMIIAIQHQFDCFVLTSAFDFGTTESHVNIRQDEWNNILMPTSTYTVPVFYTSTSTLSKKVFTQVVNEINPNIIYVNGLYTTWCNTVLMGRKFLADNNIQVIVSPRGMLQQGALAVKPFKKKLFLSVATTFGLFTNIRWHATNEEEQKDIQKNIAANATIVVAGNIPKKQLTSLENCIEKVNYQLKLVYLSLITPKKQLSLLLKVLQNCTSNIILTIYGPVKDEAYWQQCNTLMQQMPANITIQYKGNIQPNLVQETLQQYDAMILLTKGENFGHALYESLSVGTPIITSFFTPWSNLQQEQAGWNVDINNEQAIATVLDELATVPPEVWLQYRSKALQMATNYYSNGNFKQKYTELFS